VHGASFQVRSRTGGRGKVFPWERGWKDTVLLENGETVEALIRFDTYRGSTSCTATSSSTRTPGWWRTSRCSDLREPASEPRRILAAVAVLGGELAVPCTRDPLKRG